MPMTRTEKAAEISAIQEKLKGAEILILTQNAGLNAAATTELRRSARAAGVDYRVTKNTLAKLAIKGTPFEILSDKMKGPTAYVTGNDPVATAKVVADFAKKNDKLVIIGGKFGDDVMDADGVSALSKLPTMDEIRAQLIGLIQAPAQQIAAVVKAYAEKDGEAPASSESPSAEAAPEAAPAE